jgi:dephospho-CoA kinase
MARFVVALTGGISTGKSQVDALFASLGVPVVDADRIAREIVSPGQPALGEIAARFGTAVLAPDGTLERAALRRIVFEDRDARHDLEAIMHPRIRRLVQERCLSADAPYAIASIPLLAEAGASDAYRWVHRVLVVDAPVDLQRERVRHRDGIDAALADRMIAAQASRESRLGLATDVIVNDADMSGLAAPVERLHRLFLEQRPMIATRWPRHA